MSDFVELDGRSHERVGGDWYDTRTKIKVTQAISKNLNQQYGYTPQPKPAKQAKKLKYLYDVLAEAEENNSPDLYEMYNPSSRLSKQKKLKPHWLRNCVERSIRF
jgi:hypothetical protein